MADPVRETPEFPLYDTYPGKMSGDGVTGEATVGMSHMLPDGHGSMEEVAERVGRTTGQIVRDIAQRVEQLRGQLNMAQGRLRDSAGNTASDLKARAERKWEMTRERANAFACERPLEVIAGAAGVAFVLGVSIRLWRGSRG